MERRNVTIDFETYSEVDLTKTSPWAYAEHHSTRVLCMGFSFGEGKTSNLTEHEMVHARILRFRTESLHIEAHNAEFERAIWETIMVPKYGFTSDVTFECTAARAASLALPRALGEVNEVLGLSVEKDKAGHALMMKMCKPKKPTKKDPTTNHLHDEEKLQKLYEYCIQDVDAEVALSKAIRRLSASERELWQADQEINKRGIAFDRDLVLAAQKLWEQMKKRLNDDFCMLVNGRLVPDDEAKKKKMLTKGSQVKKLLPYVQENYDSGLKAIGKDEVIEVLSHDDVPPKVRRALEIRQRVSKSSVAKYTAILRGASEDGRCRSLFMFCGAGTGRWTGKRIQLQNLPAGRGLPKFDQETCITVAKVGDLDLMECLYDPPMDYLSACIRGAFAPAEGKTFACADYSSIEARALFWLVGEKDALAKLRDGVDIYKDLAAKIFDCGIDEVDGDQRQVGKQGILGLGYQMGVDKFIATCEGYDIPISHELAKNVVDTYRKTYWRVRKFWKDIEEAAMQCVRTGKPVRCGRVTWGMKDGFLKCALPSGSLLSYYNPSIKKIETPWGEMKDALHFDGHISPASFGEQSTYGGSETENIVQRLARDILGEAMLRLEAHGDYPVILHVHDEALCEVWRDKLDKEVFERLMSQLPTWAPDLPIAIDAWYGDRYHK